MKYLGGIMTPKILYLIATICAPGGAECRMQTIANSVDDNLNEIHCAYQGGVSFMAKWSVEHPNFSGWRVTRFECKRLAQPPVLEMSL